MGWSLGFDVVAQCPLTKARAGVMRLPHADVQTPVFMPVGTQGTVKGMTPEQVASLGYRLILGNTYHLGHRPGYDIVQKVGGLHSFMNWKHALLTDSGGFQMVSLSQLMNVDDQGVRFISPHTREEMLLTPEHAIQIQNALGADIIMQLDDVVPSLTTGPRVEEAMRRSIKWLDRCIAANARPQEQNLFPIVQGGLDASLRETSAREVVKRNMPGYAIGGLSGGENKNQFWRMVDVSTDILPVDKPRYLMGVGFAVDMVVSVALGADMFDCVYPTRTARFGRALLPSGVLNLKNSVYQMDFRPIDDDCSCSTCQSYSRAFLHSIIGHEPVSCHLITIHNLAFQFNLMTKVRESIIERRFASFVKKFMANSFADLNYPTWIVDSLRSVNISL